MMDTRSAHRSFYAVLASVVVSNSEILSDSDQSFGPPSESRFLFDRSDPLPDVLKIYAGGSGPSLFSQNETAKDIIKLSGKPYPHVLYIGVANYDNNHSAKAHTAQFYAFGCTVAELAVAYLTPSRGKMEEMFSWADVILIGGGNSFFAVRRLEALGLDQMILVAAARGVVLAGGSAGAIMWFNGGHSDSMKPNKYKNPPGPRLNPMLNKTELDLMWAYVRTRGLGLLDGLYCPHYDMEDSRGELRSKTFHTILRAHSGEHGIALDNWAALMISGNTYTVMQRTGMPGSRLPGGGFTKNSSLGSPWAWRVYVKWDGKVAREAVPRKGLASDLFLKARFINEDKQLAVIEQLNPDDGIEPWKG
eukprot:TRINITY_DN70648_c0_g1_i1.p1 TRINITY_DN70648_c0_g1~~TRINITY_DN70648_c0_g1_i1.p1  ORF type:complete len:362 (+),score=47.65 TRINITY_DN70648_c0_g1_i1:73-1158(+)